MRRDEALTARVDSAIISTHAPRVRRDAHNAVDLGLSGNFYSRASCEARQAAIALVEGSGGDFYSRASCEARRASFLINNTVFNFYSRASCEARHFMPRKGSCVMQFLLTRLV